MIQTDKPQPVIVIYPNGDIQSALTAPDLIHALEDLAFNVRVKLLEAAKKPIVAANGPLPGRN